MSLPLEIQMQIDLTAAAHKREIAEGFAKLRGRLLPEPSPDPMRAAMQSMQAMMMNSGLSGQAWLQYALMPSNYQTPNALMQNAPWWAQTGARSGLLGGLLG